MEALEKAGANILSNICTEAGAGICVARGSRDPSMTNLIEPKMLEIAVAIALGLQREWATLKDDGIEENHIYALTGRGQSET